jgi:hypothetical protein
MALLMNEEGHVINDESTTSRISNKTILPYMRSLLIPDNIKAKAENIYHLLGSPVKKDNNKDESGLGKSKRELIFCCIHFAYVELDIVHSPKYLASLVGIVTEKVGNKAPAKLYKIIGKYSLNKTGYHPPQRHYSIYQHGQYLIEEIKYNKAILTYVEQMSNEIERIHQKYDDSPDLIAMAIILYINGNFANNITMSYNISIVNNSWNNSQLFQELSKYVMSNGKKITTITDKYIKNLK